jgi:hypothetical protein
MLIHRVEALVEVNDDSSRHAFDRSLLQQIVLLRPETLDDLHSRLALPRPVLQERLQAFLMEGWLAGLEVTPSGLAWLAQADLPRTRMERRCFAFMETGEQSRFVSLPAEASQPLTTPPARWHFELASLEAAVAQSEAWKARHGWPTDIKRFLRPPAQPTEMDSPRIVLDRAEQAFLVWVEGEPGSAIQAYRTQPDTWELDRSPVATLPDATWFDEVAPVTADHWRESWREWGRARSLPTAEMEACQLEAVGHQLRVLAPEALIERLRKGRSESLEGTAWVLTHRGRIRPAACLQLLPANPA